TPGSLGSYAMARAIARAGGTLPLALAETGTLPYLARKTAPAVVKAPVRAANLPIGVFPASRGPSVVPRLAELFPAVRPCVDALGLALFESAARAAGAATPAVTGLLLVFGALLGRELTGGGRALEHLGLGDFSRREIRAFLQDGWASTAWRKAIQ